LACAAATPPAATRIELIVVDNDIAGTARSTVEEFAATMLLAAEQDAASRARMSTRNQHVVPERANWDKNFPQLLNAYENILSSTRASR